MIVSIGDCCYLYRICKICNERKYLMEFPPKGGKGANRSRRKSYCIACKDRKKEIINPNVNYSFDISKLNPHAMITIRGKRNDNSRFESIVSFNQAKKLVEEGRAGIYHSTLIHLFLNRRSFKISILERDGYTCHYCGSYGDTIDHKTPRSKGGLSTPSNCICSCKKCNFDKRDMDYEDYLKTKDKRT